MIIRHAKIEKTVIMGTVTPKRCILDLSTVPPVESDRKPRIRMPVQSMSRELYPNRPWVKLRELPPKQTIPGENWKWTKNFLANGGMQSLALGPVAPYSLVVLFGNILRSTRGDGYFLKTDDGLQKISNFTFRVVDRTKIIVPYGSTKEEVQVQVFYDRDGEIETDMLTIPTSEYQSIADRISRKLPECWTSPQEKREFPKIAATELSRCKTSSIRYENMQWSLPNDDGSRVFQEGSHLDAKKFPSSVATISVLREAVAMFSIAEQKVSYSLVVFQACAFLAQLFNDASYPLQHVLVLIAPSETGKSSLVKAMTQPFTKVEKKLTPIRSTKAALKGLPADYIDDVLCLDDLAPEGRRNVQEAQYEALQEMIRSFCDEGGASYKCKGDRIVQSALRGALMFTAEQSFPMIESGEARILRIEFAAHPNYEILTQLQNDPEILAIFWHQFIRFLEENYCALIAYIRRQVNVQRAQAPKFSHPRMTDILAHMDITAEILCEFLAQKGIVPELKADELLADMKQTFMELVRKQDRNTRQLDPLAEFLEATFALRSSGKLMIAETPEAYRQSSTVLQGYMDGTNLMMLLPNEVYGLVASYCQKVRHSYPLTPDTTWKLLKKNGLIQASESRGFWRRASTKADPNRPRLLCLKLSECSAYIERKGEYNG